MILLTGVSVFAETADAVLRFVESRVAAIVAAGRKVRHGDGQFFPTVFADIQAAFSGIHSVAAFADIAAAADIAFAMGFSVAEEAGTMLADCMLLSLISGATGIVSALSPMGFRNKELFTAAFA